MLTSQVPLSDFDSMLMEFDDLLHDASRAKEMRVELLRESFRHHLETNPGYHAYVKSLGVLSTTELASIDPERIPLLTSSLFKQSDLSLASVPSDEIIKYCCSSGTLGSQSIVPRDETTLTRFLDSITASLPALYDLDRTGNHHGIVLGPSTNEAGDLWFAYVIACLTVVMPSEEFVQNGVFDIERAVERVRLLIETGRQVALIGPPFRLLELGRKIADQESWPPFPENSFVVSAGGWKDQEAKSISVREFRAVMKSAFRMDSETQVRDSYNMVELNAVLNECEAHQKHVPPWVEAQCRDPRTNETLAPGEFGVLAFLDSSATSYPAFILSEDLGVVEEGVCTCGRTGQRLQVVRRVNRIEARGCALKMATGRDGQAHQTSDRFFQSIYRNPELFMPTERERD